MTTQYDFLPSDARGRLMQSAPAAETKIAGRVVRYFAGTSYLGLHGHPAVIEAACAAMREYGIASATSRGGYGENPTTLAVERRAADFFGAEAAFYFASGYLGTEILMRTLRDDFDVVLADEASHYSVMEGAESGGFRPITFRHADEAALADCLAKNVKPGQRPLVLTDGLFPVLGDTPPLADYCRALESYPGAAILVDDAHGLATIGERGFGTIELANQWHRGVNGMPPTSGQSSLNGSPKLLLCGTLGKSFGGYGGILFGSRAFIDRMKETSNLFNGASPPPVAASAACVAGIDIVRSQPELRLQLAKNAAQAKRGMRDLDFSPPDNPAPIISFTVGDAANMRRIQQALLDQGVAIGYFKRYSGTGPEGGLRIAIFATHTPEMIEQLLAELKLAIGQRKD